MAQNPTESLELEPRGRDFALVRIDAEGRKSELLLSEASVVLMPVILQQACQRILERYSSTTMAAQGATPVPRVPASRIALNTDLHRSEVLLEISDRFGNASSFSLTLEIARELAKRLPARLAEIERGRRTAQ